MMFPVSALSIGSTGQRAGAEEGADLFNRTAIGQVIKMFIGMLSLMYIGLGTYT